MATVIDIATYRQEPKPYHLEVRKLLLADLATWPVAFQRRVRKTIERQTSYSESFGDGCATWAYEGVITCRDQPGAVRWPGHLAYCLANFRNEIINYRSAETPRKRANRRTSLERGKDRFLHTLWLYGHGKVDRRALEEHAVEATRDAIADSESMWNRAKERAAYYRRRLKHGRYLKGSGKDKPFSRRTREDFRRFKEKAEEAIPYHRKHAEQLRALLDGPRSALVRDYTNCLRGTERVWT